MDEVPTLNKATMLASLLPGQETPHCNTQAPSQGLSPCSEPVPGGGSATDPHIAIPAGRWGCCQTGCLVPARALSVRAVASTQQGWSHSGGLGRLTGRRARQGGDPPGSLRGSCCTGSGPGAETAGRGGPTVGAPPARCCSVLCNNGGEKVREWHML